MANISIERYSALCSSLRASVEGISDPVAYILSIIENSVIPKPARLTKKSISALWGDSEGRDLIIQFLVEAHYFKAGAGHCTREVAPGIYEVLGTGNGVNHAYRSMKVRLQQIREAKGGLVL